VSKDGGAKFASRDVKGLPQMPGGGRGFGGGTFGLKASTNVQGQLWLGINGTLLESEDGGESFVAIGRNVTLNNFALGPAAQGRESNVPTIFVAGTIEGIAGFFRSDDRGATWVRINDDAHQFGGWPTVMVADARAWGRVYLGMNGRGILVGEPDK
jgi:photosystem II stability/assembly factor-like uncharacterized protein